MSKREWITDLERRWTENTGDRVAFIPDLRVLEFMTPIECIELFQSDWGGDRDAPPAICLPMIGIDGVPFRTLHMQSHVRIRTKIGEAHAVNRSLGQIARDFIDLGCELYLYVCPAMAFIQVEYCHVVDIRNQGAPICCVHKAKTREFLSYFVACGIDDIVDHLEDRHEDAIRGVVIDITDLWGIGGEEGRLSPTCFCDECRAYLSSKGVDLAEFETHPSPLNLALQPSRTGISYIDNLSKSEIPDSIVGKATLRGFDRDFEPEIDRFRFAESLMRYMIAKHEMVEDFLASAFSQATLPSSGGRQLRRVAIVEGVGYDWTAGVFPADLSNGVVDEIWVDPSDKAPVLRGPHKTFMWRRATYFLYAFFKALAHVADDRMRTTTGLARLSVDEIAELLRRRGAFALNNELRGAGQLAALSDTDENGRNGFVGVIFSEDVLAGLMRNPTDRAGRAAGHGGRL